MTDPWVTVIAVTYNSAEVVPGFFAGLRRAMQEIEHRIVIVDNASTDRTVQVVRECAPAAELLQLSENRGYAAGINAGLQKSGGEAVLLVNPDITLRAGALAILLSALQRPGVGIAVPQLRDVNGELQFSLRREPSISRVLGEALLGGHRAGRHGWGEMVTRRKLYTCAGTADWATGACLLVSAECQRAVGPWDERYFLYSEETDFLLRARDAGFALRYEPDAVAEHVGGEAHTSPRLFALLTANRWRFYRDRHNSPAAALFRMALILDALPRALLGRAPYQAALMALLSPRLGRWSAESLPDRSGTQRWPGRRIGLPSRSR